jgi:hypothetical protein
VGSELEEEGAEGLGVAGPDFNSTAEESTDVDISYGSARYKGA